MGIIDNSKNSLTTLLSWPSANIRAYMNTPQHLTLLRGKATKENIEGYLCPNGTFIAFGARIHPSAKIGSRCCILDCKIDEHTIIGDGSFIGRDSYIRRGTELGKGCIIGYDTKINGSTLGKDVFIGDECLLGASVSISDSSRIYSKTSLAGDMLILSNCIIGSNSALENGEIGESCILGSNVIGSNRFILPPNTKISNFMEILGLPQSRARKNSSYRLITPP